MQKFRIQFAQVTLITSMDRVPQQSTISEFDRMIDPFKINSNSNNKEKLANQKVYISDTELEHMKARVSS